MKYLYLRGNNFTAIDDKWLPLGHKLQYLDMRDNEIVCDCAVEPLRKILVDMRNRSRPEVVSSALTSLMSVAARSQSWSQELKCKGPEHLRGQLLVNLTDEQLGCFGLNWAWAVIAGMVAAVITVALLVAGCIRYRSRLLSKRSHWRWRHPVGHSPELRTSSRNMNKRDKLFPFTNHATVPRSISPPNDLNSVYNSKPPFLVMQQSSEKIDLNLSRPSLAPPLPSYVTHNLTNLMWPPAVSGHTFETFPHNSRVMSPPQTTEAVYYEIDEQRLPPNIRTLQRNRY